MVVFLRFLARSAVINCRLNTRAPPTAATATLRSCVPPNTSRAPCRRGLHTSTSQVVDFHEPAFDSATEQTSDAMILPPNGPNWRHTRLGFAPADLPHLVHIKLPRNTTEDDVKVLLARAGFPNAQITMYYHIETGTNTDFCYVNIADESQVAAAVTSLSQFTLLGSELTPEVYDSEKDSRSYQPSLFAGWLPSPTSDLESRVPRPPITAPPRLLPPLMAEQWVQFLNLPPLNPTQKEARFEILREFYQKFHQYDVVGITSIRKHRVRCNGWACKILFGNRKDAKAARKSHLEGLFMGRPSKAKFYRGGPDIHKLLWKYRQSLPENTPESDVGDLLEKKYRELMARDRPDLQRNEYPTPESAVGLKKDVPTSG